MKIGIDITTLAEGNSGIQVYIKNILHHLQDIDIKNHYYLFERSVSGFTVNNQNWRIITRKIPRFIGSRTIWFHWLLPRLLNKYRIEVLWSPEYICPIHIRKKIAVIVTIYDCTFLRFPETMIPAQLFQYRFLVFKSIKRACTVTTISSYIKKEILSRVSCYSQKRIVVAPCGKPPWELPAGYSPQSRSDFLFFAGNFEPRKNIITLIKALEHLFQAGVSVPLHIAGQSGWNNQEVHDYIKKSPVEKNITFLGYISEEQLISNYCRCKALVFPSLYEGFGMPVLEALCLDCLVLTSKDTVMQEVCGNAALYFDPRDSADLAKKILMIFQPGFDREVYLQNRKEKLKHYNWKTSAEILQGELEMAVL